MRRDMWVSKRHPDWAELTIELALVNAPIKNFAA
jgi:hypothetical protein